MAVPISSRPASERYSQKRLEKLLADSRDNVIQMVREAA